MKETVQKDAIKHPSWLDQRFQFSQHNTTLANEIRAGAATFMVMSYIIFVNPTILGTVTDPSGERLASPSVLTVTCLSAGILCLLVGVVSNYPFALAPGMGLNVAVAFQLFRLSGLLPFSCLRARLKMRFVARGGVCLWGFVTFRRAKSGRPRNRVSATPTFRRLWHCAAA